MYALSRVIPASSATFFHSNKIAIHTVNPRGVRSRYLSASVPRIFPFPLPFAILTTELIPISSAAAAKHGTVSVADLARSLARRRENKRSREIAEATGQRMKLNETAIIGLLELPDACYLQLLSQELSSGNFSRRGNEVQTSLAYYLSVPPRLQLRFPF